MTVPSEYLSWEVTQDCRYEFVDGQIVAMTEGSIVTILLSILTISGDRPFALAVVGSMLPMLKFALRRLEAIFSSHVKWRSTLDINLEYGDVDREILSSSKSNS